MSSSFVDRSGSRIDHLNIAVPDLGAAAGFYEPVLASIGIVKMLEIPAGLTEGQLAMVGFGWPERKPYFWLLERGSVGTGMHLAFTVDDRAAVEAFYRAALAAGAVPEHAPAVHAEYHEDYFGAFVTDPLGISLEAVCHLRPGS
ncbi:Catechol 2,3-dioxygenase [Amycolatopsis xylanica]|uniref:Catechol 2,3-dioxygenase n=1 Tax=Amycolatopsis xylanica TaxID=589385 RepID=A0A1H2VMB8_9PSEU|nr:VOC family protein [Amycolatopsis xylanica]SDW69446.1 Catechol 2,3-dioxygenase [Amycolatopsis xylanica]